MRPDAGGSGRSGGSSSAWRPVAPLRAEEVSWSASFATAMEQARAEQKYVMVDFFTTWCHWCKVLDEKTYTDDRVSPSPTRWSA